MGGTEIAKIHPVYSQIIYVGLKYVHEWQKIAKIFCVQVLHVMFLHHPTKTCSKSLYLYPSVTRTVKFKLETDRSSLYHKQSGVWG